MQRKEVDGQRRQHSFIVERIEMECWLKEDVGSEESVLKLEDTGICLCPERDDLEEKRQLQN